MSSKTLLTLAGCLGAGMILSSLPADASWLSDLLSQDINICVFNCEPPKETIEPYGITPLTPDQDIAIEHLAMPQSRKAMINRLGFPEGISKSSDWYRMSDGGQARVFYHGTTAYRIEIRHPPDLSRIAKVIN